LPGTNTQVYKK